MQVLVRRDLSLLENPFDKSDKVNTEDFLLVNHSDDEDDFVVFLFVKVYVLKITLIVLYEGKFYFNYFQSIFHCTIRSENNSHALLSIGNNLNKILTGKLFCTKLC